MSKDQIAHDIDEWSKDRLNQLITDMLVRYQIADVPARVAHASVGALILSKAAGFCAHMTNFTPGECGEMFAAAVGRMRKPLPRAREQS